MITGGDLPLAWVQGNMDKAALWCSYCYGESKIECDLGLQTAEEE